MNEQNLSPFGIEDYSPDGNRHVSPEISRAQSAGIYKPSLLPSRINHLHFGLDLQLITHGSLDVIIGQGQIFHLEAGNIFIIPGGNRHRIELPADGHVCCYGMEIAPNYFAELARIPELNAIAKRLSNMNNPFPVRLIDDQVEFQSLRTLFEEMFAINCDNDTPCRTRILQTYQELISLYVVKLLRTDAHRLQEHPRTRRILDVQSWLDRHFADQITLGDMAKMAHLSVPHFSNLFRKITGMSPKSYLRTRRLEHAAFLLQHSCSPVTDIAQNVGFNCHTNFTNAFTKFTHQSPSDFRKKFQTSGQDR